MQKINVRNLLRMQKTGQTIRPLHIILGNRNLEKFGEIVNIPADSITYHPQFNAVDELSFNVYRERNGEIENLWNKIIDFKTVYVKEFDEWFEISVSTDESEINTKKVVTAKSLCEAELGQVILYDVEINTEDDIAREEYTEPTIFYNPNKKSCSLLNRLLEKAPGYTIAHVDKTLLNIQRSFSIDGTSIYDFLTSTLSQEIGCIFLFDSNTRSIYVYDMETCCLSCDYRSENSFTVCPKCGGTILHEPYGKDTSIFIDKNNLGSDIQLTSETDNIKNCFRVIGGDDLINATLKNINPNGSNYIYYFNKDTMSDMPCELQSKIKSYDELVNEYSNNKSFSLEASLVKRYNDIIEYIKKYYPDTTYSSIQQQYIGWSNITSVYYNIIDLYSYLNNSMMPTWKQQDKTATSQLALLTPSNLSPVAVMDVSKISVYTANNAVLAMAKAIIDTSIYKVEILDGSTLKSQTWAGRFKLTSYSDKEDTAEMKTAISITINDDYIAYVNQQVDKAMGKVNDQGLQEIYKIESLDAFKIAIHKYSIQRLTSYQSAYQTAINVLTEQGVAANSSELHDSVYLPYYERFVALEAELSYRNSQLDTLTGLQKYIENLIEKTHNELDFEAYIGEQYWKLFTYYRREDDYSNENYISDGLTNTELIDKANELLVVAKKELVKSGEKQFTISGTLQNLLLLTDKDGNRIFEAILDDFTLGNFIRTKIDGKIYVMRLADISISYGDLSKLSVTFSDAYRYGNSDVNIVKDILTKSQSMATSYSSTIKQASQGEKANLTFEKLQKNGLDSALYNVHNTNSTAIFDEHGILIRSYDDVLDDYKDEQARISSNEFVYTTDRWRTAETAIGKQKYILNGVTYEEYGVNSKFVISGKIIAGDIYSSNYTTNTNGVCTSGTHFNLDSGDCAIGGDKLVYNSKKNKLSIKDVNIDWSSSSSPAISDIEDLDNRLNENTNAIRNNEKALTDYKAEVKLSDEEFSRNFTKMVTDEKERATTVETRISETAGKINWLIKDGTSESSMSLTSTAYDLIANNINLTGKVTFNSFNDSTKNQFDTISQDSSAAKNAADKALIAANNAIKSVDIEYYISTSPTQLIGGNWQTNAPKWSNNTYIWSRTKTLNENNQISYSNPACISGYTPQKNVDYFDGNTSYLWIRYSNSADGSNMTDTPTSSTIYIGTATTINNNSAPSLPSEYKWVKYVGNDGVPGAAGKDGKTAYIHIAYSDSSDGKTGFDTVNGTNKKFIGQYTDYIKEDSTDPSSYTWSLIKGKSIKSLIEQYYLSTSSVSQVNGSWSTNSPTWEEGYYIWTKSHIIWEDNTTTDTTPILANSLNSANSNALTAKKTAQDIVDNIYTINTTTIDGAKITTGSITANKINVDDLSALRATIADWNITSKAIYAATSDEKYKVYIQNPQQKDTWVFSCQEKNDTNGKYYGNWYVTTSGYMYGKNVDITGNVNATKITASSGTIGNWTISNGSLVTYKTGKDNVKGISLDQSYIKFYGWMDDYENLIGTITTGRHTTNNELRRSLIVAADYKDTLALGYISDKSDGSTYVSSILINDDMAGRVNINTPNLIISGDSSTGNNFVTTKIYCYNPNNGENTQNVRIFNGADTKYFYQNCELSVWGASHFKYNMYCDATFYGNVSSDSDRNIKKDIEALDINSSANFIYSLIPSEFRFKNGESNRLHHGFIAQEVKIAMNENDWGLFVDKKIKNEQYKTIVSTDSETSKSEVEMTARYSLRYDEFIADIVATLQSQNNRIKELEQKINSNQLEG